jgi:hypothetical protein
MIQKGPISSIQNEVVGPPLPTTRYEPEAFGLSKEAVLQIAELTRALFGGVVTVDKSCDPEYTADEYLVFAADTGLQPGEIVRAESEWVCRVEAIAPGCDMLRLSIRPRD